MPPALENLLILRNTNLKPWELDDPRFTLGMRNRIVGAIEGELKAERVARAERGL